ncbi:MAG: hypothetical protein V4473_02540 [Patescibacteria group bacterium]
MIELSMENTMPKDEVPEVPAGLIPLTDVTIPSEESVMEEELKKTLLEEKLSRFEKLLDQKLSNQESD